MLEFYERLLLVPQVVTIFCTQHAGII